MEPSVRARVERVWAERLGCADPLFRTPGIHPVAHPRPAALYAVLVGQAAVVAAPREMHARLSALGEPEAAIGPRALSGMVPSGARWVGPAFVGYGSVRPPRPRVEIRVVADVDLEPLRRAVTPTEWEHANLRAALPIFATVADGSIASAAGGERLRGDVAHIGVVTHPAQRGRGLGRAVVAAAFAHALDEGMLPQYQTLLANHGAMSIAHALGFEFFARTLAARWEARESDPDGS
jgi:GNAT superfamily N-acetyltransferase